VISAGAAAGENLHWSCEAAGISLPAKAFFPSMTDKAMLLEVCQAFDGDSSGIEIEVDPSTPGNVLLA